jgi:predicted adenylyl cyclase CyaB
MHNYEVEVKSLLGTKENAQKLKLSLSKDKNLKLIGQGKQLNHYFNSPTSLAGTYDAIAPHVSQDRISSFQRIVKDGKKVSIRTRDADGKVLFVIKASISDDSSDNGVSRIEFESETKDLTLAKLDQILLDAGLTYQAKWSREREEYQTGQMHICIDRNAGYGYLAEFELVVDDESKVKEARDQITSFMQEMQVSELPQDRLERMFAHYNKHWGEYYGTDKMFIIE